MPASTTSRPSASCTSSKARRAHHGDRQRRQSRDQPVGAVDPDRGLEDPAHRRDRNPDERADHVPGRPAHRPRHPRGARHRGRRAEVGRRHFDVSFLFGGQIKGSRMRLFMVYTAGNFIECTTDTPYLQIGEHKYGKPVLDRAMHYDVELYEALKTGLISMDSTMRSNLGVGLPIDVLVVRADACEADLNHRIEAGEPYFHDLRSRWSAALRAAHQNIPRPPYKTETETKN